MVIMPYSNFFSIYIFAILLLPAVILGLLGKNIKWYGILVSFPMVAVIVGLPSLHLFLFLIFLICELILIYSYNWYVNRILQNGGIPSEFVYFCVFSLSILPVFIKLCLPFSGSSFMGFIGISYMSFRIWQLIIEIHDKHINKLPLLETVYFLTFFPTLSSGPIDRFSRFSEDLNKRITSEQYINEYFAEGLKRIFMGILYKFIIAFLINNFLIEKFPYDYSFQNKFIYFYAYTFYLFFDFAGYSNFAIGTSYLLGIKAPENFNKPFLARNMKEFWDRWHISLSKWFGDYLFSRFVLNTLRNKTFKSKKTAIRCGFFITMTIMGFWHGFTLFYILYGIYQGLMLILTDIYLKTKFYKKYKSFKFYDWTARIINFHIIAFGLLLFSGKLISI